jgi:predicted MFS family arabinose efflux permease
VEVAGADLKGRLRLLRAATFLSVFDRFTIAPMLVTIAAALRVSLAEVVAAASLYYLMYGLMQPAWGLLSDRLGRVWVMRFALVGVAVPGVVSALAPNLWVLVASRALAGGLLAAVIPASLVYIGDTVPIKERQAALAEQLGAGAAATALATVAGGAAAYFGLWRLAFAAPALVAGALGLFLLSRLPEPDRKASEEGTLAGLKLFLTRPWALLVVLLALVEGGAILGFLTYLAPALEEVGYSAAVSGIAVGLYGVSTMLWSRAVRPAAVKLGPHGLILLGGGMLAAGYATGAAGQHLIGIGTAAVLVGGGFAFMHSTLQTWATAVLPQARAVVISFFASALFVGSGVATSVAAPLAEAGSYPLLFTLAAAFAIPLSVAASLTRLRYGDR